MLRGLSPGRPRVSSDIRVMLKVVAMRVPGQIAREMERTPAKPRVFCHQELLRHLDAHQDGVNPEQAQIKQRVNV